MEGIGREQFDGYQINGSMDVWSEPFSPRKYSYALDSHKFEFVCVNLNVNRPNIGPNLIWIASDSVMEMW